MIRILYYWHLVFKNKIRRRTRPTASVEYFRLNSPQLLECRTLLSADLAAKPLVDLHDCHCVATLACDMVVLDAVSTEPQLAVPAQLCVSISNELRVGQVGTQLCISVMDGPPKGNLDAWIDWNGDGHFDGGSERIATKVVVSGGIVTLQVDVPASSRSGSVVARFKFIPEQAEPGSMHDVPLTVLPPVFPSGQFRPAMTIDATASMQFASTADLDRDGDLDILTASFNGSGRIAWYENVGSMGFTRHVISENEADATSIIANDLDGDGDLDLVVSSLTNNSISWYENNGQTQFTNRVITRSAPKASSLFVADLDQDGDSDIVFATKGDNSVSWMENRGDQGFVKHVIDTQSDAPCSVHAADMDGDGDLDVISGSFSDNTIAWFENNGQQIFSKRIITTTASGVRGMSVADLDGDGDQDVIAALLHGNSITWYENNGPEGFERHVISSTAIRAAAVFLADLDGDWDLDILAASRGNKTIAWFENVESLPFPQHTITTTNIEARGIIAGDVDGDGDLDVISASRDGASLTWYQNVTNPDSVTVTLTSTVSTFTQSPVIPVTVRFNRTVTELTPEKLIVMNGVISHFEGSGSSYELEITGNGEGKVSVIILADSVFDAAGYGNPETELSREITFAPPDLHLNEPAAVFVRDGGRITVTPGLTVSGSRLAGGTLAVVLTSPKKNRSGLDVFNTSALSALGTLTQSVIDGKHVNTVNLESTTTNRMIEEALRSITFETSKTGVSVKTRKVMIKLTDAAGAPSPTISHMIEVRRRSGATPRR